MKTTVGPQTSAVANGEISAEFAGANDQRAMDGYFNVSGTDRNEGASTVFVMCRSAASDGYVQLGSGHIVGANGAFVPPGVQAGQYSVTFRLPEGCAPSSIGVRDDKNDKAFLKDVKVIPC
jgi:hypothetical protein